ncbi:MAG: Hsp70 family protein, partial [Thermoanaerobaculia bacterium]|nr:Hsp70 family protein [Thermoanaerobaculia bacterium]
AHAEEDRQFHALVAARNHADSMIHATRKSMEQLGEKMESGEKESIEAAIKELEEVMKGEDKERIETLTKSLGDASAKMAERLYAQSSAGPADLGGSGAGHSEGPSSGARDDVVDAEFEEVKDDKK